MATVIWSLNAQEEKRRLYLVGQLEFGTYIANKTALRIKEIQKLLERFPKMGYKEQLLVERSLTYRAYHINKRFKIIYWFDEVKDMVIIEDIWDVHREPQNLKNRIVYK
ncbi:MAG: type II toxin-antitoxin system RelE/ParE family toxin [Bacteroidaceae bacterium]|nr:type II toxin-antitoxin system RelE/ParE family toxin [Bacteroidaceae bacterium]